MLYFVFLVAWRNLPLFLFFLLWLILSLCFRFLILILFSHSFIPCFTLGLPLRGSLFDSSPLQNIIGIALDPLLRVSQVLLRSANYFSFSSLSLGRSRSWSRRPRFPILNFNLYNRLSFVVAMISLSYGSSSRLHPLILNAIVSFEHFTGQVFVSQSTRLPFAS